MDPLMRLKKVFEVAGVPMGRDCSEQSSTAMQKGLVGIIIKGGRVVIGARQDLSRLDLEKLLMAARALDEVIAIFHERFDWEIGANSLLGRVVEKFIGVTVGREQVIANVAVVINPGDGIVVIEWSQLYLGDLEIKPRRQAAAYLDVRPLLPLAA